MMNAKGKGRGKKENAPAVEEKGTSNEGELMSVLKGVADGLGTLNARMDGFEKEVRDLKNGGKDRFKDSARPEDVKSASESRQGVDNKLCAIVDELLGEDFGIKIAQFPDKPGFLFSLIVPKRLSDNVVDKRPKMDPENPHEYLKDSFDNVVFEDYVPEDRRSRAIMSLDNYDTIRQHCERVRSYIVAYFQKTQKPLPEFRVK